MASARENIRSSQGQNPQSKPAAQQAIEALLAAPGLLGAKGRVLGTYLTRPKGPYVGVYDDKVAVSWEKPNLCVLEHIRDSPPWFMMPPLNVPMLQLRKIQSLPFYLKQDRAFAPTTLAVYLTMLKRSSSLILALVIGSSVLAGTARPQDEHVCQMAGMETMPCCKKEQTKSVVGESGSSEQCCVTIPQETGSSGTSFNLRPPSFSITVIHPAIVQSPLAAPKTTECSFSTQVFLPNLQASYIRNLSILI